MLRLLGYRPATSALSTIADSAERDALFMSLAMTVTRACYHRKRFEQIINHLANRRIQAGGVASSDTCSRYAIIEASAFLVAARTIVDEVLYIAARRSSVSPKDAVSWEVGPATTCDLSKNPKYNVDEVIRLRNHLSWYKEMNEYRNVLVHRGWREQLGGYFPVGSTIPEAADPTRNDLLVPDRNSLSRVRRGHQWTYHQGTRLEDIIDRAGNGLVVFLDEVAKESWGGAHPAPGTAPNDKLPNVFITLPHAGLVVSTTISIPVFTEEELASNFHQIAYQGDAHLVLSEVLPTLLDDGATRSGPGFWLSVPTGDHISETLTRAGVALEGHVVVLLNPTVGADGSVNGSELARFDVADLVSQKDKYLLKKILVDEIPGATRLLLWRTHP
jgi:hypothetical protein